VWGCEFFGEDADEEVAHREATEKIERLVRYLRSIQRPGWIERWPTRFRSPECGA
jgi:hypothetical protein